MNKNEKSLWGRCKQAFTNVVVGMTAAASVMAALPANAHESHPEPIPSAPALSDMGWSMPSTVLRTTSLTVTPQSQELKALNTLEFMAKRPGASKADRKALQSAIFDKATEGFEIDGTIGTRTNKRLAERKADLERRIDMAADAPAFGLVVPFSPQESSLTSAIAPVAECATDMMRVAFAICVKGDYSSPVGFRWHPTRRASGGSGLWSMHQGTDYAAPIGTAVNVNADAVVLEVGRNKDYGKFVVLAFANGAIGLSAHHQQINVKEGELVNAGEQYATVGRTGIGTGPHVHFELAYKVGQKWELASGEYLAARGGINASPADMAEAVEISRTKFKVKSNTPAYLNSLVNRYDATDIRTQVAAVIAKQQPIVASFAGATLQAIAQQEEPCRTAGNFIESNPYATRVTDGSRLSRMTFGMLG